jgi:hypothetical protein
MYSRVFFLGCLLLTMCGKEVHELQRNRAPADAAFIDASPGPIFQFPTLNVGNSATQVFTLTNTGKKSATQLTGDFGLSVSFFFDGGFPGKGGTCGNTLNPGESCSVSVTFAPGYISDFEQILRAAYDNGYSTVLSDYPILRGRGQ